MLLYHLTKQSTRQMQLDEPTQAKHESKQRNVPQQHHRTSGGGNKHAAARPLSVGYLAAAAAHIGDGRRYIASLLPFFVAPMPLPVESTITIGRVITRSSEKSCWLALIQPDGTELSLPEGMMLGEKVSR